LNKCWQKHPEDRYPGAEDLIVDLRAIRRSLTGPVAAPVVPSTVVGRRHAGLGVIIVDDEEPARLILKEYLAAEPDAVLLAECRNGFEAVKAVTELEPDLVFLDVQMPKLDGFEVVELIGPGPTIVFVTAFDQHALRAFEVNALDYLLKPVAPERFSAALARARTRTRQPSLPIQKIVAEARPERQNLERIVIKQGADVVVLPIAEVDYIEAQDDYVSIHSRGREWLKQQRMTALESALDSSIFVRIHRSYLLNLDCLSKLEADGKDSRVAILKDGTRLPVSRTGHVRLKQLL
jgi:two-component system LytT family response regulator